MKKLLLWQKALILLSVGVVAVAMWFLETGCLFQNFFGIPCMSCGMTRAFFAFINGNFAESFSLHPMLLSVPVLALVFLFSHKLFKGKARIPTIILLMSITLGFTANYILNLIALYI